MFEALIPLEWVENVRRMEGQEFLLVASLLIGFALAAFYGVFRFFHRARIIEDIPTSRIRSAAQGYVELDGLAELMEGEPILAPLTGRRCTWYSYSIDKRVDHHDSKGGRRSHWRTIDSGVSDNLFLLRDETGDCVIDPEGAEVTPSFNQTWYGHTPHPTSVPEPGGLGLHFGNDRYRYNEKRIDIADSLYAIGWFKTVGGSADVPNTADEMRALLNHWKRNPEFLRPFDRNGDGKIDSSEWEEVRQTAKRQAVAMQQERAARVFNLLSKPESSRTPYILSVLPQEKLVKRLKIFASLSLTGFLLLGAVASWMIAIRIGG